MITSQIPPSALFSGDTGNGQRGPISRTIYGDTSTCSSPIALLEELDPCQFSPQEPKTEPLTPQAASAGELLEADETLVSISTVFNPYSCSPQPDILFVSSDGVLFYVHSQVLEKASSGPSAFHRILEKSKSNSRSGAPLLLLAATKQLAPGSINKLIAIPDTSSVLNIVLHLLYGSSAAQHSPDFETLATAVNHMPLYNIKPKDYIVPHTPLYDLLLSHAPLVPLKVYALAGHHDLYHLAVATSSHLLYFPLCDIPEEMADYMGAVYLHRLLKLHLVRFNALKSILLSPPEPHIPTKYCGFEDQERLTRAWALVSSYLVWDVRADLSTHSLQSAFQPLTKDIVCNLCVTGLEERIKDAVTRWASVKHTI